MFLVEIEVKRDVDNQNIKKLKDLLNQAPYFSMQPDIFSRTNLELDNIEETGTAGAFLFLLNNLPYKAFRLLPYYGGMQYSYIAYRLGFSPINPLKYDLPASLGKECPLLSYILAANTTEVTELSKLEDVKAVKIIDDNIHWQKEAELLWLMQNNVATITKSNIEKLLGLNNIDIQTEFWQKLNSLPVLSDEILCNLVAEYNLRKWYYGSQIKKLQNIPNNLLFLFSSTDNKLLYQEQVLGVYRCLFGYDHLRAQKIWRSAVRHQPLPRPLLSNSEEMFLDELICHSKFLYPKGTHLTKVFFLTKFLKGTDDE